MFKKFISLMFLAVASLASCSSFGDENKTVLASNFDNYLNESNTQFAKPDVEEITTNLNIGANFLIYFSETGCGACEKFKPIITNYLRDKNPLIYNFDVSADREELKQLQNLYGDKFFEKNESNNYVVLTPSLYVVSEGSINVVNYSSYMQKETAFNNYMNSRYRTNNLYFIKGNVLDKKIKSSEFLNVSFDFMNSNQVEIYKDKIVPNYRTTGKQVVVSNIKDESKISLKVIKNKVIKKNIEINQQTADEIIKEVF